MRWANKQNASSFTFVLNVLYFNRMKTVYYVRGLYGLWIIRLSTILKGYKV